MGEKGVDELTQNILNSKVSLENMGRELETSASTIQEYLVQNTNTLLTNKLQGAIKEKNRSEMSKHNKYLEEMQNSLDNLIAWQDVIFKQIRQTGPTDDLKKSLASVMESDVTDASNWIGQILKKEQFKINTKKVIGEGAYGVVYEGEIHGITVAVKQLKVMTEFELFVKECTLLSKIRSPFVTRYMGACVNEQIKDKKECFILTELGTMGSLNTLLYGEPKKATAYTMDISVKCRILRDVARGMKFLHDEVNLVHRDLKPSNVMIDSKFRARIGDFNLSLLLQKNSSSVLPAPVGTLPYMAPELIEKWKKPDSMEDEDLKKCDVYSFGILMNEVISEKKPYVGITEENCLQKKVIDKEKPPMPEKYTNENPLCILMKKCWNDEPSIRIPFSKILASDGYLLSTKKNISTASNYYEIFREKLIKQFKEGI